MTKREYELRETNQSRNEEDSSSSFLLGAIVGGVIGAAATLLFSTKTGKELRDSVRKDSILDLTENVKAKTITLSQGLAQQSTDLLNKVKGKPHVQDAALEESEQAYISIQGPNSNSGSNKAAGTSKSDEIRRKLAEAQKAFDEEESKVKL
ncbi:YtxH domain-containing protein [Bacillus sp. FJAT-29814]|uniref:YtxH domain-containing protein n=1 Tax=Bacillus sp. FJAT-29814 TaxID=1729688 RepID=UPI0008347D90|nr:YtxH domain-containing protein [Bacillus sp. FJAT-29814]